MNKVTGQEHGFAVNLMQHLVVPTFVLDPDCRVIIWNRACERLTGVPAKDVLGTREHWRAFYDAPRPCLADLVVLGRTGEMEALYIDAGNPSELAHCVRATNWCAMPQAGTKLFLAVDAGPIYDDEGNLLAVVETLRDMTEQKRAQTALEHLACSDGLTGVANRRSFDEKLRHEWRRERRDAQHLSLLMIDVDHFKRYNDTYGHQQGDECLRRIAGAMTEVVFRPADMVARYGGEEFGIILPVTDIEGASVVAGRIQERVAEMNIPHATSDEGRVTLSIGIATNAPADGDQAEALLLAADAALYEAKHAGRNRLARAN